MIATIATTLGAAAASTLFLFMANASGTESRPALRGIAGAFIGGGIVTDLALLPTIVMPSTDQVVYPGTTLVHGEPWPNGRA